MKILLLFYDSVISQLFSENVTLMREVTLKQREQARIQVLNTVLEQHLSIRQAAEIMGVSERHTKRLLAAYRKKGPAALAHGNRGRRPTMPFPKQQRRPW